MFTLIVASSENTTHSIVKTIPMGFLIYLKLFPFYLLLLVCLLLLTYSMVQSPSWEAFVYCVCLCTVFASVYTVFPSLCTVFLSVYCACPYVYCFCLCTVFASVCTVFPSLCTAFVSLCNVFVCYVDALLHKVKVKVKFSLSKPWKHIRGLEVLLHSFLALALDGVSV